MESVQLYFDLIKAGLKRFAEYRSSFIAGFFGLIMINGSSILLIWVMLKNFHTLNEWTFWQIVFNYCLFLSCLGFHNTFFRHISDLENHIVNGTFDRFLLRPVSPLLQLASEKISITDLCDFTTGMIGALFAAKMLHIQITVGFMLGFIVSIINGVYVFTAILFSVSCISFWTMKSKSILYSTNEIQESVQHYPISIFNKAFKFIVTVLLPYGLVNYYPSLILLNKVNVHWMYVIMIALVDIIYGVIGAFLWQRGLKRYNGSGS